ncbi:uncharacterized protein V1516DRAFT_673628 [Lipomyces oligophaga]|uniref:uncharacterized protein n=1 Tax=Lipomyces oligophaga TaxID=45792 RepID=UPI0034CEEC65
MDFSTQAQKFTRLLPEFVVSIGQSLFGDVCYKILIYDAGLLVIPPQDQAVLPCAKLAFSKLLGLLIVIASSVIKLPQIIKLINAQSAVGVSIIGTVLEAASYLIMFAYAVRFGFPFSTYGEQSFLFVQDVAIVILLLVYSSKQTLAFGVLPVVAGISYYALVYVPGPSPTTLATLQTLTIPLSLASKIPQIITIVREKSTGQLSAVAVFAYLGGSLARVFTTLQEVDDQIILAGNLLSAVLNGILAILMAIYWNSLTPKAPEDEAKKKQ